MKLKREVGINHCHKKQGNKVGIIPFLVLPILSND